MAVKSSNLDRLRVLLFMLYAGGSPDARDDEFEKQFVLLLTEQHENESQGKAPTLPRFSVN